MLTMHFCKNFLHYGDKNVILTDYFTGDFAGIDLGSIRLSVLVAIHFATLHKPTTTPNTKQYDAMTTKFA